jgi:hypothetical protein
MSLALAIFKAFTKKGEPMAMTELQKQIVLLKVETGFKILWAILKPLAVIVLAVGIVVFGALFSVLGASLTGKGRR